METTGPIGTLGINLKLFIAQLINFAVILLVLWRFAYKPLLGIMKTRQKTIEESLDNAKKIETRLGQAEQEYNEKMRQAKKDAVAVIEQAEKEAAERGAEIKKKTEEDIQKLVAGAKIQITAEKEAAERAVREHAAELIATAVKKLVSEKLDTAGNEAFIETLLSEKKV